MEVPTIATLSAPPIPVVVRTPVPTSDDYARLKARVQAAGLLRKQPGYYAMVISANTLMLVLCIGALVLIRNTWLLALDAVLLGLVSGQLGFQLHDAAHRQMFDSARMNRWVGLLTGNLLLGMSYGWWYQKHNRHHANPNDVDEDPDINSPAIVYSREQALSRRGPLRALAAYQAYFFFPLLFLLGFSMHGSSYIHLAGREARYRGEEVALLTLHNVLYFGLLLAVLGPWRALLVIFLHKASGGFYLASVFAPNHKGMPQTDATHRLDFLRAQVLTARNVRASRIKDLWYGSLNYQIEHHLFPTMPRNNLRKAHRLIKSYCAEIEVPFYEASMTQSYRELLAFLHEVGRPLRTGSSRA
ncbi:MAG: acyl-CoA desaturase [Candidatus Dormibacteraeota bacterium]|nr:acyl-CoA desaturase [Candidatus Dormibacteraeota bacterium]